MTSIEWSSITQSLSTALLDEIIEAAITESACPCHEIHARQQDEDLYPSHSERQSMLDSIRGNFKCPPFEELDKEFGHLKEEIIKRTKCKAEHNQKHGMVQRGNVSATSKPWDWLIFFSSLSAGSDLVAILNKNQFVVYKAHTNTAYHGYITDRPGLDYNHTHRLKSAKFINPKETRVFFDKWRMWICYVLEILNQLKKDLYL